MSSKIGIKLELDGEKAFNLALKEMNAGLKLLGTELKATSSQFLDNNKSVEATTAKNQVLNKQITAKKEKVDFLKQALQQSTEAYGENDRRTQAWASKLNIAQAELNKMQNQLKIGSAKLEKYGSFSEKTARSVSKLDTEISSLKGELDDIDKKYKGNANSVEALQEKQNVLTNILAKQNEKVNTLKDAMDTASKAYGESSEETKKWEKALHSAEQELNDTEKELKNVDKEMQNASKSTKTFGEMLKANLTADAIKSGVQKLGEAFNSVKNYIGDAVKSASEYGKEMSLM